MALRARARHARGARHRLPPGAVGADQPGHGRAALRRRRTRSARSCRPCCRMRPGGRHRRRNPHRRRQHRHAGRRCARLRALTAAALVGQARADGLRGLRRRDPDDIEQGLQGPGLSGRGVQRARRRRCFMAGFLRGWLRGRAAGSAAAPRPTPAARWWCRATAARRRCRAGRSCSTSSRTARPRARLREDALLEHLHRATTRTRPLG